MASSRLLTPRLSARLRPVSLARSQLRTKATAPFRLPDPRNEPNPLYTRGSPERLKLEAALSDLRSQLPVQSHVYYNGQTQQVSKSWDQPLPGEHATNFTNYPVASKEQVSAAIESALEAKKDWENTPFVDRAAIFLKAAELVTGKYRYELIAATMLGQGKNIWQAEIDAAAELADFFRLNCNFAAELLERQPTRGSDGIRMEYRPLEGFVYAISPFNFTALGGSLLSGPALMGNVVLWKPAPSNIYASTLLYKILLEAGLPPDVVQFVPGDAEEITSVALSHRDFAGLNFIGSSDVFRSIYAKIGEGIGKKTYREFPRIVGETSGKNFHLVHNTADIPSAVNHTIRGAFEYQGQKCSATSRVYIPESRAPEFLSLLQSGVRDITIGNPDKDLEAFMGPVIHRRSFDKIKSIIDSSNADPSLTLLAGGTYDDSVGFYVHPTVYQTNSPDHPLFNEEIFGPVLAVYVYPDAEWTPLLRKVDQVGGGFALTGAVFAKDRAVIRQAEDALRYAAGNFYISRSLPRSSVEDKLTCVDCKTTAALIGQQSFGGARASGTNDKAGSSDILRRFTSPRMIKEEFFPLDGFKYPSNH
ncbi:Aldehyde/histidinol dehydrogenase [Aspergillus aurantiobrunneus]